MLDAHDRGHPVDTGGYGIAGTAPTRPGDLGSRGSRVPHDVDDVSRPSSARVLDYLLGGAVNSAVDRELGRELARREPIVLGMVRENRSFLRRAVTFLMHSGVDQFLDLGSGIPSMGNVHEVARRLDPTARVAYVDVDPVAAGHGTSVVAAQPGLSMTEADLRDPEAVLGAPGVAGTLDLSRPVGLCLFSVLQHLTEVDDPSAVVRRYLGALAPGSALAISHVTADDERIDVAGIRSLTGAYARGALTPRSRDEVARLFAGVDLVDPGLVFAAMWRSESATLSDDVACGHRAGVGFVPR